MQRIDRAAGLPKDTPVLIGNSVLTSSMLVGMFLSLYAAYGSYATFTVADTAAMDELHHAANITCAEWAWNQAAWEWWCPDRQFVITTRSGNGLDNAWMLVARYERGDRLPFLYHPRMHGLLDLVHELIHLADGVDDGRINGSPGHTRPEERPAGIRDWHWAAGDDAHWYVWEVFRTGKLQETGESLFAGGVLAEVHRAREPRFLGNH